VSGSHSDSVTGDGQRALADYSAQAADPLPHVLILRALRETAEIHARCRARISGENWRSIGREAPFRRKGAPERSAASVAVADGGLSAAALPKASGVGRGQRPRLQ
jgi:hypothetical protein